MGRDQRGIGRSGCACFQHPAQYRRVPATPERCDGASEPAWRYHPLVRARLPIDTTLLKPGLRLAVGLSGGADSVALLRALAERSGELGLVLHAAHLHHGLRGAEADADLAFCRDLAASLGLPFHEAHVDTAFEAKANPGIGPILAIPPNPLKPSRKQPAVCAIAGSASSWPRAESTPSPPRIPSTIRPRPCSPNSCAGRGPKACRASIQDLKTRKARSSARSWRPLEPRSKPISRELGQPWREDSTNRHLTFTRNRIRHELLPLLETWNPRLREHLSQMAELARDEEAWWQAELARVAPQLILPGRPVRGGGRAAADGLALDVTRSCLARPRPCNAAFCAMPPPNWAPRPILPPPSPSAPWRSPAAPAKKANWPRAFAPSAPTANCA